MSLNEEFLPKRDTVFTAMFLNKDLCELVLNIILDEKIELVDIVAEFKNNLKKAALNSVFFDIRTKTVDNKIVTFDLQRVYEKDKIINRTVYYACREVGAQEVNRGKYQDLESVVVTFLLTEAPVKHTKAYKKIQLIDNESGEVYSNLLTIYEINLKLVGNKDSIEMCIIRDFFWIDTQNKYEKFIENYKDNNMAKMLVKEYELVTKGTTLSDLVKLEEEEKFMIRLTEEERMIERQEGREEGREEGIQTGIEQSITLVVKSFKDMNLENVDIITNLVKNFKLTPEQAGRYLN